MGIATVSRLMDIATGIDRTSVAPGGRSEAIRLVGIATGIGRSAADRLMGAMGIAASIDRTECIDWSGNIDELFAAWCASLENRWCAPKA